MAPWHDLLSVWFVSYLAPFLVAAVIALSWTQKKHWYERNITIAHGALLVSTALSQYVIYSRHLAFPWDQGMFWLVVFAVSALLALALLWKFSPLLGIGYALSALIQEATMLSIAFLLLPVFPVWAVILLVAPIYVVAHFLTFEHWLLKLFLVSASGIAVILLFASTHNFWLIAALHTILGAVLIRSRVLYLGIQS